MSQQSPNVTSQKPQSFLLRDVTFDFRKLFGALVKAVGHGVAGKWDDLGSDAADAIAALGLSTEPGELATLLVQRSLVRSVFELVGESPSLHAAADGALKVEFQTTSESFEIDSRFLDRPDQISIVETAKGLLLKWLLAAGFVEASAQAISNRLPAYFVYALNHEWRRNAKVYQPLIEALATPFTKAGEREWAWMSYHALLQRKINESMLDEPFSLNQLYVPLNGTYLDERTRGVESSDDAASFARTPPRLVVDIQQELTTWLKENDPHDAIRVLSGGPGSGKSSFTKMFAAAVAKAELRKVLFIPLHLIDPEKSLEDEVGRFVQDEGILQQNPLDHSSSEQNLFIIFDGLDELASQGKAAAETTRAFVSEIEKTVQRRNSRHTRLQVLISGRELVVQQNQSEFRHPGQVLTLLPYFIGSHSSTGQYSDPNALLKKDLRDQWWANYGTLTGRPINSLPRELKRTDLEEVTAQPLLNYLVALSYTRGKLDFGGDINLNIIYSDLVAAVYERGYERHRAHTSVRHMRLEEFLKVLEEIALAAWHGDGRTTTIREIQQHCEHGGIGHLLEKFKEGAEAGVTRLLAAFFFRQHGRRASGDPTFVFTHKSFGEYLAALRLSRAVSRINREMERRSVSDDEGWNERDALNHWVELSGPSAITSYLFVFLCAEFRLRQLSEATVIQKNFARLFSSVLRNGLSMTGLSSSSFRVALFRARNAEEALLACLNACARYTRNISAIEHLDPTTFGGWLRRIQGQRNGPASPLVMDCLSFLYLRGISLDICDLYGANFAGSDLSEVNAHGVCARTANFSQAILTKAVFSWADLEDAQFDDAVLTQTQFTDARLIDCNFKGANLKGITVEGALIEDVEPADLNQRLLALAEKQAMERAKVHPQRKARILSSRVLRKEEDVPHGS